MEAREIHINKLSRIYIVLNGLRMLYQHNASPCILHYQVHGQDEDPCKGVVCPRGRMCWSYTDSGENYTTCECPEECSADPEPVCSFYHREFNNRCEMHRYACAHDLTMKVMNRGKCPTESK